MDLAGLELSARSMASSMLSKRVPQSQPPDATTPLLQNKDICARVASTSGPPAHTFVEPGCRELQGIGYMEGGRADGQAVAWWPIPCMTQGPGYATAASRLRDGCVPATRRLRPGYATATEHLASGAGWKVDKGVADCAGGVATVTPGCAGLATPLAPLLHWQSRLYAQTGPPKRRDG